MLTAAKKLNNPERRAKHDHDTTQRFNERWETEVEKSDHSESRRAVAQAHSSMAQLSRALSLSLSASSSSSSHSLDPLPFYFLLSSFADDDDDDDDVAKNTGQKVEWKGRTEPGTRAKSPEGL